MKTIRTHSPKAQPFPRGIRKAFDAKYSRFTLDFPNWDPEELQRIAAKLRSISLFGFSASGTGNFTSPAGQASLVLAAI